jgi:outer membrane protein assembly factor BamB
VKVVPPPVIIVQPPSVPSAGGSAVGRWLIAILVLPLAIGGAVISALNKGGKMKQGTLAGTLSKLSVGKITWSSNNLCFVDGNGDRALDPVGFGGYAGQNDRVHALDLMSGAELWASEPFPSSKAWCGDHGTLLVAGDDFSLVALDGRTGKTRWRTTLSDKASEVVTAGECVAVHTDDNEHIGFALATGAPQKCVVPKDKEKHHHGFGEVPDHVTIRSGDLDVTLTVKKPGTPLLVLSAKRGDQQLWKTTLPAQELSYDKRLLFAGGGKILVFGGAMPSNNHLVIVGVDAATGQVAYTQNEMSAFSSSIFFSDAKQEGPYVVAHFGSEIHAYDPATGEAVW